MRKILGVILGSLALLSVAAAVGGGLAWYKYQQDVKANSQGPPPEVPETVAAQRVVALDYRQSVNAMGSVLAPRWITLRNEESGTISALHVKSGAVVEEGKILLELDSSVEKASLESAAAKRKLAELVYNRNKSLFKNRSIPTTEYEQSESELAQANAEISRLNAVIAKKTMRAPFRAKVGLINVFTGQYLSEGVEITTLHGIDNFVNVDFMLPQSAADDIELGRKVRFEHAGKSLTGKIVAWDSKSDKMTRNMLVRAELPNPPAGLSPNDSISVSLEYGPLIHAHAVPIEALRRTPMGTHVFVVETDKNGALRAGLRAVVPGRIIGNQLVILRGLTEKDLVVAEGAFKLRAGVALRLASETNTEAKAKADEPAAAATTTKGDAR